MKQRYVQISSPIRPVLLILRFRRCGFGNHALDPPCARFCSCSGPVPLTQSASFVAVSQRLVASDDFPQITYELNSGRVLEAFHRGSNMHDARTSCGDSRSPSREIRSGRAAIVDAVSSQWRIATTPSYSTPTQLSGAFFLSLCSRTVSNFPIALLWATDPLVLH